MNDLVNYITSEFNQRFTGVNLKFYFNDDHETWGVDVNDLHFTFEVRSDDDAFQFVERNGRHADVVFDLPSNDD